MKTKAPFCPYCKKDAVLVQGEEIYGPGFSYSNKPFWLCKPCDAHVGTHPGTTTPLGSPANRETRKARNIAHSAFDPIWRGTKIKRTDAYAMLAERLGLKPERCHIGYFDIEKCKRTVQISEEIKATITK